jgi:hypothetical protein
MNDFFGSFIYFEIFRTGDLRFRRARHTFFAHALLRFSRRFISFFRRAAARLLLYAACALFEIFTSLLPRPGAKPQARSGATRTHRLSRTEPRTRCHRLATAGAAPTARRAEWARVSVAWPWETSAWRAAEDRPQPDRDMDRERHAAVRAGGRGSALISALYSVHSPARLVGLLPIEQQVGEGRRVAVVQELAHAVAAPQRGQLRHPVGRECQRAAAAQPPVLLAV